MELKEMIKVMQHFEDGGDVEFSIDNFKTVLGESNKECDGELCWDWDEFKYRIKREKEKVTIERWLVESDSGYFYIIEATDVSKLVYYKKVKLLDTYEVEI